MNPNPDRDNSGHRKGDSGSPPASPYGPQPHGPDEVAGGADSSPYENDDSDDRKDIAEENYTSGRTPDSAERPNSNP